MRMKVLHIATARTWRGGEQQVAYLVDTLLKKGIEQHILCSKGGQLAAYCEEKRWSYTAIKKRSNIDIRYIWAIGKTIKKHQITHVHTHDAHAHTFAVLAFLLFSFKKPFFVHRRVDFPAKNNVLSRMKYNFSMITNFICVSQTIANVLKPSLQVPEKVKVIYSGVDLGRFGESLDKGNSLHSLINVSKYTQIIGNVAALAPHKDYPTFLGTLALLFEEGWSGHAVIIGGDGGCQSEVELWLSNSPWKSRIHLLGYRKDVAELLPQLALLLFTSKTEGLGTTVLDAFACRVPVVATAGGGIVELVRHQETGWLAPVGDERALADGVLRVLSDEHLRKQIVENAYRKVQQFSIENTADATLALYNEQQ